MKRKILLAAALYGVPVALSALPVDDAKAGVWNVLAYEFEFASGVKLTKADLESCVTNFAKYPKVPLVIEHADTDLFGATEWAEPHGWISALRVGTFKRPDGRVVASLEGCIQADDATRLAINGDEKNPPKWPFGSVTVGNRTDEETGKELGMCLWSFSLTAHPRLKDVPKLAASAAAPGGLRAGYYWGEIDDRADLVEALRCIFELPALAPEADVIAQLDRFEKLVTGAEAADGIDTDCLLSNLRSVMRLPALSTAAEVIAEVRRGLSTLPATDPAETFSGAAAKESAMKTFLQLAALIGIAAATEDEASAKITATAKEGLELRTALGAKDHSEATAKLAKLTTDAAKVPQLESDLSTFRKAQEDRETAERDAYVADVVLGMALPEDQRPRVTASLKLHARTDWAGFQKEYKRPSAATLGQRAQDGERTQRVGGKTRSTPTAAAGANDEPSAQDIALGAQRLVEEYRERGQHLSMSEAIGMLMAKGGQEDSEPADPTDGGAAEPGDDQ